VELGPGSVPATQIGADLETVDGIADAVAGGRFAAMEPIFILDSTIFFI